MHRKIEISERTVIFTLALLAAIWLILQIRDILFFLFIAFLIMTAIGLNEHAYARRQMTWFKKQSDIHWFDIRSEKLVDNIELLVRKWYT